MASKIRIAEPADSPAVLAIYAPFCNSSSTSFETVAPSAQQMAKRIDGTTAEYPWLVCEVDDVLAGYVYASRHRERAAYRWMVEVTVYISDCFRRRGVGRALYTSLFAILAEQNFCKAFAGITLPNPQSVGLHEALGFKLIAVYPGVGYKLGRWLDVGWWQLQLRPEEIPPPEPVPFSSIRSAASVACALAAGERLLTPSLKA
jgi:L-amino acid N-acyltransferase YncA